MSYRIQTDPRNPVEAVPATVDNVAPSVSVSKTDNSTTTVALNTDGTIDWWWFGNQTASNLPYFMTVNGGIGHYAMKRLSPNWLWRGFRWVFGAGSVTATTAASSRTMTATIADSLDNVTAVNHTNKTGYGTTTTGLAGFGMHLTLPTSEVSRRLRIYTVATSCDVVCNATVYGNDGTTATDTKTVVTASGATNHSIWEITFAAPSRGGRLVIDLHVTNNNNATCNLTVQAMSLAEP